MDLTFNELSKRSGLSANYIGGVEGGRRDPSLSTMLMLAQGLNISPAEMMGGTFDLSPAAFDVARLIDEIPTPTKHVVITLMSMLVPARPKRRRRTRGADRSPNPPPRRRKRKDDGEPIRSAAKPPRAQRGARGERVERGARGARGARKGPARS